MFGKLLGKSAKFIENETASGKSFTADTLSGLYKQIEQKFSEQYGKIGVTDVNIAMNGFTVDTLDDLAEFDTEKVQKGSEIAYQTNDGAISGYIEVGLRNAANQSQTNTGIKAGKDVSVGIGVSILVPPVGLAYIANGVRKSMDRVLKEDSWFELSIYANQDLEASQYKRLKNLITDLKKTYH